MQTERHKRKTHGIRSLVLPIRTEGVGHGVFQEPRLHGGTVSTVDRALTVRGGARAYFVAGLSDGGSDHPRSWSHLRYEQLKLRGRSLRFTADLSRVGCGCVAALYLVAMPDRPDATQHLSGYCDAVPRRSGSGPCVEIDVLEANSYGAHASLHTRAGRDADGSCNEAGCTVNWGNRSASAAGVPVSRLFGRAAGALLNTRHPFGVEASVSARGSLSVRLSQRGRVVPFFNSSAAANPTPFGAKGLPPADAALARAALSRGLVMVASLWASPGRTAEWLDGGCGGAAISRCELPSAALTLSNFSLRPHTPWPNASRHNATHVRRGGRKVSKEPRPSHEPRDAHRSYTRTVKGSAERKRGMRPDY